MTAGAATLLALTALLAALGTPFVGSAAEPSPLEPGRQVLVMLRMAPQHYRPDTAYGGAYGDGDGRSARWDVAQRLARQQGLAVSDEWPMPILSVDCFVMTLPPQLSEEVVVKRLSADPAVSWSQPLHVYQTKGETSSRGDPLARLQPDEHEWRLNALHRVATGRGVQVAVIDSMIDRRHVDLASAVELVENFVPGRPSTPEDHGTGVAGVIAAQAGNGVGVVGVSPQARLMGLRACWQVRPGAGGTVCDSLSLARALDFAIGHKAQVINMSLSGPDDLLLSKLLATAVRQRMVVVAAYDRAAPRGGFPASEPGVVAVANEEGPPIPGVVAAPGRDVPTTEPGGRWSMVDGSSFSAAQVSGLYALLREREPWVHTASILIARPHDDTIDACATLMQWPQPCHCSCARSDEAEKPTLR